MIEQKNQDINPQTVNQSTPTTKKKQATKKPATTLKQKLLENSNLMEVLDNEHLKVLATVTKDIGTREMRISLTIAYKDGDILPAQYFRKSQLSNKNLFNGFLDFEGFTKEDVERLYNSVKDKLESLPTVKEQNGVCSVTQAHEALVNYAMEYKDPQTVYMKDGFVYIESRYLDCVLRTLEIPFSRLELKKNFKNAGLLKTNSSTTGHYYDYKVKLDWFFCFDALLGKGVK